jgi:hypothetical protein
MVSLRPKKTIKGLWWLLLKHSHNLDPERNEAQRLQEALAQIRTQGSNASAASFHDDWCRRARATGIRVLQTMSQKQNRSFPECRLRVQRSAILHPQAPRTPRGEIQISCLNTCNTLRTVFDVEPEFGEAVALGGFQLGARYNQL